MRLFVPTPHLFLQGVLGAHTKHLVKLQQKLIALSAPASHGVRVWATLLMRNMPDGAYPIITHLVAGRGRGAEVRRGARARIPPRRPSRLLVRGKAHHLEVQHLRSNQAGTLLTSCKGKSAGLLAGTCCSNETAPCF